MLIRNSAEYINESAINSMIGLTPISEIVQNYNSPRVFPVHYRHDVLPQEFRGRKTVLGTVETLKHQNFFGLYIR